MQLLPFALVERRQELLLESTRELAQTLELRPSLGRQLDDVPAPVVRVAATDHQAARLELVEEPDELAAVVAERVGDRSLRLSRAFVEGEEDRVVVGVKAGLLVGVERPVLGDEAEPLEQEERRGSQLRRQRAAPADGRLVRRSTSSGNRVAPAIVAEV